MAEGNKTLGRFVLDGIPPSPRGVPQVEVSFDIDANGILNVKARDKATNKEQSVRIEASTGLSKDEIERMKRDAEAHGAEDKAKREAVETKNQADQLVYAAEKALRDSSANSEQAAKVPPEVKKEIESKIEELKKAKEGGNTSEIKSKMEDLSRTVSKIGEALYKQPPPSGNPQEKGREAEFEDVKKEDDKNPDSGADSA